MNQMLKICLGAAVVAILFFYAGTKYGDKNVQAASVVRAGYNQGTTTGGARGTRGMLGGGFVTGTILSKDAQGITVSVQGGGSKIIFFGSSTPIMKTVVGSLSDLTVGTNVVVTGQASADGSVTARSIELRQAMPSAGGN